MRVLSALTVALLAAGCPKPVDLPPSVTQGDLMAPPQLPSPRAGTYARVPQTPKDPVVRAVVGERTWDASLAGAAAGLALPATEDTGGFTRRELREAAWQAGYPWPILDLGVWPTNEAGAPPAGVRGWLSEQPDDRDVGVVRARSRGEDLWVALAGRPTLPLGVVPREPPLGYLLRLPPVPGGTWRASDGAGVLREGSLDTALELPLDVPGEWVVQVRDAGGDLARMALYVDMEAPRHSALPGRNATLSSARQARDRALEVVQIVREAYGVDPVTPDPVLQRAAEGITSADEALQRARSLGRAQDLAVGFQCTAATIEDCLDKVVYDPRHRRAFVGAEAWAAGLAVDWSPSRVTLTGVMLGDQG
jgi:hypothetical protein